MLITQERLKKILDYNPENGVFTWKIVHSGKVKVGSKAGCITSNGYHQIRINGKSYKTHRLAWIYSFGSFPLNIIDHISGDKTDNRISNLRDVSHSQNSQNAKRHRNGQSVGIGFRKDNMKWTARVKIGNHWKQVGCFSTEGEARRARLKTLKNLKIQT